MKYEKYLFVIVPFLFVILLPIILLICDSLTDGSGGFTIEHLTTLLINKRQLGLFQNSIMLGALSSLGASALGVPAAFLLYCSDIPLRKPLIFLSLFPLIIPPYVQALVWSKTGMPFMFSMTGGVFVFALSFFPFVMLITGSGLQASDINAHHAACMSRGKTATALKVTLPLVTPHIIAGAIIVFVFAFINFEVPDILRIPVFPVEIFCQFSAFYDTGKATLLSFPLIVTSLVLIWGQMHYMKKKTYISMRFDAPSDALFSLGRGRYPSCLMLLSIVLGSALIPVGLLIKGSHGSEGIIKALDTGLEQIYYSVSVSTLSALIMICFSFIVSYYLVRTDGKINQILHYFSQIPLGVPPVVLGIGMIRVWNREWTAPMYDSIWIIVLALVCAYTPFVLNVIYAKLIQVPKELEEAAALFNKSRFKIVSHIVLPMVFPGLIAAFFIGFSLSLSNIGTVLLIIPPGETTLPISLYNFLHYGAFDMVCGQSLILIMICAGLAGILLIGYRFINRGVKK
ncbi:ABC transporter permease [Desulfobacter latus]|uniref:Iron ABC transporter permease n=1 Tax=Desulfobacter latus TaxID=2292 RepID=A0A850T2T2_9BACT|nr:iron ABC transporter permease [Desulfobacter latus]NWH05411.1 iron ABC transporter permease [Desulfobacter latus]